MPAARSFSRVVPPGLAVGMLALPIVSCSTPAGPAASPAADAAPPIDRRVEIVAKALEDKLNLMLATAQPGAVK
jgi:hypothetical protein